MSVCVYVYTVHKTWAWNIIIINHNTNPSIWNNATASFVLQYCCESLRFQSRIKLYPPKKNLFYSIRAHTNHSFEFLDMSQRTKNFTFTYEREQHGETTKNVRNFRCHCHCVPRLVLMAAFFLLLIHTLSVCTFYYRILFAKIYEIKKKD